MEFRDLRRQYGRIKADIDAQIEETILSTRFISGDKVEALEETLADYVNRKYCISCANGTDAITIALKAYGIGKGEAVFVPDFTFFSSGECPAVEGATPVFVDVRRDTFNMDPTALATAIEEVLSEGELCPKPVVAVDLFGQPFDYTAIRKLCDTYGLLLLEDAAQGFGGVYTAENGIEKKACSLGDISITSFFPAKPLGCYGDGGAIFTDDKEIADLCRSIAVHGKAMQRPEDPEAKYDNVRLGMNSRLDTLQAGILLAKFPVFQSEELQAVNRIAHLYNEYLQKYTSVECPIVPTGYYSSWAQYTIKLGRGVDRAVLQKNLKAQGIPTNIYYKRPMHAQKAFKGTRSERAKCPVTEALCESVLCLPMHPYLKEAEVSSISEALKSLLEQTETDFYTV